MAVKTLHEPEPPKGTLTRSELFPIAIGGCIGAGVVTLVVPAMGMTGNSVWLAYIAAIIYGFILIAPIAFIGSALRMGGGTYSIVCDFLGAKAGGIYSVAFVTQCLGLSMMGVSAAAYAADIIPSLSSPTAQTLIAAGLVTLFYIINLLGIKSMAKIQKYMTWPLLGALLMFIVFGLTKLQYPVFNFADEGFFTQGFLKMDGTMITGGFFAAVLLFTFSTQGYRDAISYGRFSKDAKKDIPWTILICVPVLILVYGGVALAAAGSTRLEEFGSSTSLVAAARNLMPPALVFVFVLLGPIFALLTTLNASFAGMSLVIQQSCTDGWLPRKLAENNKYGVPKYILTIMYAIMILPIVLGFSITTITNNVQLFISVVSMLLNIAFFMLPKKYPAAWKACRLHVANWIYYLICTLSLLLNLIVFVKSCLSLDLTIVIVSVVVLVLCIAYALFRVEKGDVTIRSSVWDDTEKTN